MTDLRRRRALQGLVVTGAAGWLAQPAAADDGTWHSVDVTGAVPALAFAMTDATTGKAVTAADFRGKVVMLYLGYTFCPDICPLTLTRVVSVFDRLGKQANDVRFLFVTVDPTRDTVAVLRQYTAAFSPNVVGLRGGDDAIARIAQSYRLAYSVQAATATTPYEVTHSSAIYVFGRDGAARLIVPSMASKTPDIAGTAADLRRLIGEPAGRGWLSRLISAL
jgi:protein SCO1/2